TPEPLTLARLKAVSVRGGAATVLAMGVTQFFRLVIIAALARLLSPSDFGVVAMTMGVLSVGIVFRDLGLASATVQREHLTNSQVNTLFWINLGFGAAATLLFWVCAPLVAAFFKDPRLLAVTHVLSFSFVLGAVAAQHGALLTRHLRFSTNAKIQIASTLLSGLLAVLLARAGFGYWALVLQTIAADVFTAVLVWSKSDWRPGWPRFDPSVRDMLSYGGYMVGFGLLCYAALNASVLLLGRYWGAHLLGQYNRADILSRTLLGYISQPLGNVAAPSLSRLQSEPAVYNRYYLRCMEIMSALSFPLGAACLVLAPDLVRVVLGPQWEQAGTLMRYLAPGMCVQPIMSSTGWLYMSSGRVRRMLYWGVIGWGALLVATVSGLVGGAEGVAIAYSVTLLVLTPWCMSFAFKGTGLKLSDLGRSCSGPLAAAAIAAVAAALVQYLLQGRNVWLRLPASSGTLTAVYAFTLLVVFGQGKAILDILSHMRPAKA
ncbi:MAG TPA: lipopolysaccharide biosynthesis protein, partial [Nevskia sp.]|nr:lipopolysaccharide biosynthesis protein [Nevskia sp.]